jgi:hypothetical protein
MAPDARRPAGRPNAISVAVAARRVATDSFLLEDGGKQMALQAICRWPSLM